jgi:hypothetical protein
MGGGEFPGDESPGYYQMFLRNNPKAKGQIACCRTEFDKWRRLVDDAGGSWLGGGATDIGGRINNLKM